MADTRNKISYFLEQVQRWLPYIIQDETKKQELKDALKRILAQGEEQRTTEAAKGSAQERQAFQKAILDAFAKRVRPEISGPQYLQESGFGLPAGVTLPPNSLENLEKTITDAIQAEKLRQAGEIIPEELLKGIEQGIGPEFTTQLSQDIIKQREAAKARPLEERRVKVEEAKVPLEERRVDVSEAEQKRLQKELGGSLEDMTPKEARDRLSKLDELKWGYQAKMGEKTDVFGERFGEDHFRELKSVIDQIEKKQDEIRKEFHLKKEAKEEDKFGFKLGETRTSPKGKVRYVGNNQWELID